MNYSNFKLMVSAEIIREKVKLLFNEVVSVRRHIHKHPELSFQEYQTSRYISGKLQEYGIDHKTVAGTGIHARITGKRGTDGRHLALRAELDALPIHEETKVPYKSVNPGVMHACGHDVHSACLLGSAKIIKSLDKDFTGIVDLIFQPGEETLPGGAKKNA
jgi:amidohydrolase